MSADITDKTKISLFAAIAGLPFLIGGILWLTSIDAKASIAKDQLNELRPMVQEILTRVIRLEEHQKRE